MQDFESCFYDGFLLSNTKESLSIIKEKISKKELLILKKEDKSFFFYNKEQNLLFYFLNELKKYDLPKFYIKIIEKNEKELLKHEHFLELNSFNLLFKHKEMSLKNEGLTNPSFDFIKEAKKDDDKELHSFFSKYFTKELFYFSRAELRKKSDEILLYKENESIKAALIFSKNINSAYLDFIAVDKDLKYKNVAYALLSTFFAKNKQSKFFKLFVELSNQRAINFYKRAKFEYRDRILNFYKNF